MITSDKAIELLQKKIDAIEFIDDRSTFYNWKKITISTLLNLYKEDDVRLIGFMSIKPFIPNTYTSGGTDVLIKAKNTSKVFLEGLIEDLKVFGVPMNKILSSSNGINVNVNQQNNQNQTTNITMNLELFINSIKDELKGGQVKELKAILNGDEEPEQKKKSFFDKLKSFGSDVSSNILANVLTNPDVYTNIGGML